MITADSADFIITVDTEGAEITESNGFRWTRSRGTEYPSRLWAFNSDTSSDSTVEYRIRLNEGGLYRISTLPSPEGFYPPLINIEADGNNTELWPRNPVKGWAPYGSKALDIEDPEITVTIGNALPANEKSSKVSFEALRIQKVSTAEDGSIINPEDYALKDEAGYHKEPRTAQQLLAKWQDLYPRYEGRLFTEEPRVSSPYSAGEVSPEYLKDCINFLNFIRYTAGYPGDLELSTHANSFLQAGAVVSAANRRISHIPRQPADMSDSFFKNAQAGCRNNLHASNDPLHRDPLFIAALNLVNDIGEESLGHRYSVLYAYATAAGFGFAVNESGDYAALSMSTPTSRDEVFKYDFFSWPPEGAYPVQFLEGYHTKTAWSVTLGSEYDFSYSNAHKAHVDIVYTPVNPAFAEERWSLDQLTNDNPAVPGDYFALRTNSSVRTDIAFRPGGLEDIEPFDEGDRFKIKISGIYDKEGKPATLEYEMELVVLSRSYTFLNRAILPSN